MSEFTPEFFEATKHNMQHGKIQYLNVAGIIPEVMEERHVICRLPANEMHMNHVGIVYAGSYFVFAEATGAHLLKCTYGSKYITIIKGATIDFVKPAKTDLVIDLSMTAEEAVERVAYVEERGRGQYPLDVPIKDSEGNLCANVRVVFYLMKNNG